MGFPDIRSKSRRQSIERIVGLADNVVLVVKGIAVHHRPKNFFPHNFHLFVGVHENRRLDEISFIACRCPRVAFAPSESPDSR